MAPRRPPSTLLQACGLCMPTPAPAPHGMGPAPRPTFRKSAMAWISESVDVAMAARSSFSLRGRAAAGPCWRRAPPQRAARPPTQQPARSPALQAPPATPGMASWPMRPPGAQGRRAWWWHGRLRHLLASACMPGTPGCVPAAASLILSCSCTCCACAEYCDITSLQVNARAVSPRPRLPAGAGAGGGGDDGGAALRRTGRWAGWGARICAGTGGRVTPCPWPSKRAHSL